MTEEIIIDVSNCRDKHDDDCMAMPICNEYGDLMDYQSCEAQTLCPYRTERIIDRLKQENEMIINEYNKLQAEIIGDMKFKELMLTGITPLKVLQNLKERNRELQAFYDVHESFKTDFDTNRKLLDNYRSVLEEIREICKKAISLYKEEQKDNERPNGISTWKNSQFEKILNKINEVLNKQNSK